MRKKYSAIHKYLYHKSVSFVACCLQENATDFQNMHHRSKKHLSHLNIQLLLQRNTTGVTSGAGTAYTSGTPEVTPSF